MSDKKELNLVKKTFFLGKETSKMSKTTDDLLLNIQHHPLSKNKSNIQNNINKLNKISLTSSKFFRTRTIPSQSKSTSSLLYYQIKDTLKQIIEKGVQFNLNDIIELGEKGTQYHQYQLYMIRLNIALSIVLFINIILAIIENQIFLANTIDHLAQYGVNNITNNRSITRTENSLLIINLLLSLASGVIVIIIFQLKVFLFRIDGIISKSDGIFSSSTLLNRFIIRLIIVLIFFPPGVNGLIFINNQKKRNYIYSWNGIICTISLIKIGIIFESINSVSVYTSTMANSVCKNYKAQLDNKFVFKANMKHSPFLFLLLFGGFSLIILTFLMINFEFATISNGEFNEGFQKWQNAIWFIFSTMETITFGNIKPSTDLGYAICFISGITGYLLLTLLLISISFYSEFTFDEMKSFKKLKTLLSDENQEKKAINLIRVSVYLRFYIIKRRNAITKGEQREILMKIFALMCHLKLFITSFHNEYHISRSWSIPVDDYLINLENNFSKDLLALQRAMKSFNCIDNNYVKSVEINQKAIEEDLKNIKMMQNSIANYIVNLNNENTLYQFKDSSSNRKGKKRNFIENEIIVNQTISNESPSDFIKEENEEIEYNQDGVHRKSLFN